MVEVRAGESALTVVALVTLPQPVGLPGGWSEGPLPVGVAPGQDQERTAEDEASERRQDWKARPGELLYGPTRRHALLTDETFSGWCVLAVEALDLPDADAGAQERGPSGRAAGYGIVHLTSVSVDPAADLRSLRGALTSGPIPWFGQHRPGRRDVFLVSFCRPPLRPGQDLDAESCYRYLMDAATGFDGLDPAAGAEGDTRTPLPERLRPSKSWRIAVARSGVAAIATRDDGFADIAEELIRTTYTDAALFALVQRNRAAHLERITQRAFDRHLGSDDHLSAGSAREMEHDLDQLRALLDDSRFGVLAAQPWKRVGTFVDVHAALQEQLRLSETIAASDEAAARLIAMLDDELQDRRDRFLALVSAMFIFPGLVAGFAQLGFRTDDKSLLVTSILISALLSAAFYVLSRFWLGGDTTSAFGRSIRTRMATRREARRVDDGSREEGVRS